MLAILEYGAGNQTSVQRALAWLGINSFITADPESLLGASGVIFPGVGAAGQAMGRLRSTGLDTVLKELVDKGVPLLGICLGCQILLERSQESDTRTLGILPGLCRRFPENILDEAGEPLRVPHMGWNAARPVEGNILFEGIAPDAQFYFVHSYYPDPAAELVLGKTRHGLEFASSFGRPGLWAVQFHPEKSGAPGLRLLQNFSAWCAEK